MSSEKGRVSVNFKMNYTINNHPGVTSDEINSAMAASMARVVADAGLDDFYYDADNEAALSVAAITDANIFRDIPAFNLKSRFLNRGSSEIKSDKPKTKSKKRAKVVHISPTPKGGYVWKPPTQKDIHAPAAVGTYETFTQESASRSRRKIKKVRDSPKTDQSNKLKGAFKNYTFVDAKAGLRIVYQKYGKKMAEVIEKIYRNETANFTSKQYAESGTPGMQAVPGKKAPYYGWGKKYFEPTALPIGTTNMWDNKGNSTNGGNAQDTKTKIGFIIMSSVESAMLYLAKFIQSQNGNYARWHSTVSSHQDAYKKLLEHYPSTLVNEIEKEEMPQP